MILFEELLEGENDFSYRGAEGAEVRKIIFTREQLLKQTFHSIIRHLRKNSSFTAGFSFTRMHHAQQ
jgi:hypothetical protein